MPAMFNAAGADQAAQLYKKGNFELDAMADEARKREIIRQSAAAAIDPASGEYDLNRHTQALEQGGFPEIAHEFRQKTIEGAGRAYNVLDQALKTTAADGSNYAQVREQLVKAGIPQQSIPQQFDPEWLKAQHRRLGMTIEKFGPMEQVATGPGPGGAVLYGQKNLETGQLSNVRDLSPQRPLAGRAGGGGGGFAPSNTQKKAEFYAETYQVPLPVALDIVRNEEEGGSPQKLYGRLVQTMLGQYASEEEATSLAEAVVARVYGRGASDPVARPNRPLAGDARDANVGIPPQGHPQADPGMDVRPNNRPVPGPTLNREVITRPAPTVSVPLPGGRTATVPNRDPAAQAADRPNAEGWAPKQIYTTRDGRRWRLGANGQAELVAQ